MKNDEDPYALSLDSILGGEGPDTESLPEDDLIEDDVDDEVEIDDEGDTDDEGDGDVANDDVNDETDWQKRFKDTERAFQEKAREVADLRQRIEAMESRQAAPENDPPPDDFDFEEAYAEDPAKAMLELNRRQAAQIAKAAKDAAEAAVAAVQDQTRSTSLAEQEEKARQEHDDYDQYVNDDFIKRVQADTFLYAKWLKDGGTAEAAYKLAKRTAEFEEFISGDAPKKTPAKTQPAGRRSLRGAPKSSPAKPGKRNKMTHESALEGILGR